MTKNFYLILAILLLTCFVSCKKYISAKPDQSLVIPSTVSDVQALLDDYLRINRLDPGSPEISSDNYYLSDLDWSNLNEYFQRMYLWNKEYLFQPGTNNDWVNCYTLVYKANVALHALNEIATNEDSHTEFNNVKGQALFFRSHAFLNAVNIWSLAYDETNSSTDMGIPLRISPNFNERSVRSSVKDSYDRILKDLKEASILLPDQSVHVLRPSKPASYALLARTYLAMRKYDSCFKYSNLSLGYRSELMDYNSTPSAQSSNFPFAPVFTPLNVENIFDICLSGPLTQPLQQVRAKIDTTLYNSYSANDLRKKVFFRTNTGANVGTYSFKGSYEGNATLYGGVSVNEVLLMRAECYARLADKQSAMSDLNYLLRNRWVDGTFTELVAQDDQEALNLVLTERRKELLFRGLRWMDIKRLNKEGHNIKLKRIINGNVYELPPNDLRFALPIPEDVISLSQMQQNQR